MVSKYFNITIIIIILITLIHLSLSYLPTPTKVRLKKIFLIIHIASHCIVTPHFFHFRYIENVWYQNFIMILL